MTLLPVRAYDPDELESRMELLASQWPFGPTYFCLLLPVILLGPFVAVAILGFSLLRAEPLPGWVFVVLVALAALFAWHLWPFASPRGLSRSAFWSFWWFASMVSLVLVPLAAIREAHKRDGFRRLRRRKKKRRKRPAGNADGLS